MDKPSVRGNEVRHGTYIYLDALSKDTLDALGNIPLSEAMLYQLNTGSTPLFPTTPRQEAEIAKTGGGLVFGLRRRTDKACIGVCFLADVNWKSRHAQLHIGIMDEASFTVDMLLDVIQTVLQFAYWEANLNRIYVHCIEDNRLLHEALEHAGFTNEGRLRQEVYRNGRYLDKFIYSILRREWAG